MSHIVCAHCGVSDDRNTGMSSDIEGKPVHVHANCKQEYDAARAQKIREARQGKPEHFEESAKPSIAPPPTVRDMSDAIMGLHGKVDKILKLLEKPKKVSKKK